MEQQSRTVDEGERTLEDIEDERLRKLGIDPEKMRRIRRQKRQRAEGELYNEIIRNSGCTNVIAQGRRRTQRGMTEISRCGREGRPGPGPTLAEWYDQT
jgi:hypothetical protein